MRIPIQAKVNAMISAIEFLDAFESEADEPMDREARIWLLEKLEKDIQKLLKKKAEETP